MSSSPCARAPIAIDGPAAAGKSTIGAALAERCGYLLFDTGVTYRAFTLAAIERGVPPGDVAACTDLARSLAFEVFGEGETRIRVQGKDVTDQLREPRVERAVSSYSAIPAVRQQMVALQRRVAAEQAAVVIGRDIGTVVLPEAPVKLFITASDEERARRRARQSGQWGTVQDSAGARADIERRDRLDSSRAVAPLKAAEDAVVIDTTALTLDEAIARALDVVTCRQS